MFITVTAEWPSDRRIRLNVAHIVAYTDALVPPPDGGGPFIPGGTVSLTGGGERDVRETPEQIDALIAEAMAAARVTFAIAN